MYARLYALAASVLGPAAAELTVPPPAASPGRRTASIDELVADLAVVADSLRGHGAGALADGRSSSRCAAPW